VTNKSCARNLTSTFKSNINGDWETTETFLFSDFVILMSENGDSTSHWTLGFTSADEWAQDRCLVRDGVLKSDEIQRIKVSMIIM
jgi:hypothetical protein